MQATRSETDPATSAGHGPAALGAHMPRGASGAALTPVVPAPGTELLVELRIPRRRERVRDVRHAAEGVLAARGCLRTADVVQVLDEGVSNAIKHGRQDDDAVVRVCIAATGDATIRLWVINETAPGDHSNVSRLMTSLTHTDTTVGPTAGAAVGDMVGGVADELAELVAAGDDAECGRGLLFVKAFADECSAHCWRGFTVLAAAFEAAVREGDAP